MDSSRVGNIKRPRLINSDSGQSTVEYILLIAVVVSLMTAIWNSKAFNDFLGEDSDFFNGIAEMIRVHYQFAANVPAGTEYDSPTLNHPSFYSGETRFFTFGGGDTYPRGL